MATNIPPAERLLDLVIALSSTSGLTKGDIRARVAGYSAAASDVAFARMFERDKDLLRELGIPLLIVSQSPYTDDVRYRIDTDAYTMAEIELSAPELAIVAMACEVWRDAAWRARAGRAVTKLRAVGTGGVAAVAGPAIQLSDAGDGLDVVLRAITSHTVLEFDYVAASTAQRTHRIVEPWRVVARGRAWYLVGLDRGRDAPRVFRLARISGTITARPDLGPVRPVDAASVAAAMNSGEVGTVHTARLVVEPGAAPALRQRGRWRRKVNDPHLGWDEIEVDYTSLQELAGEIAAAGPGVIAAGPPALRAAVVEILRQVAHG